MGLLLLSAAQGSDITITADGPDEQQAMDALCALVEARIRRSALSTYGQDEPCA